MRRFTAQHWRAERVVSMAVVLTIVAFAAGVALGLIFGRVPAGLRQSGHSGFCVCGHHAVYHDRHTCTHRLCACRAGQHEVFARYGRSAAIRDVPPPNAPASQSSLVCRI